MRSRATRKSSDRSRCPKGSDAQKGAPPDGEGPRFDLALRDEDRAGLFALRCAERDAGAAGIAAHPLALDDEAELAALRGLAFEDERVALGLRGIGIGHAFVGEHAFLGSGGSRKGDYGGGGGDKKLGHDLSPSKTRKSQTGIPLCLVLF